MSTEERDSEDASREELVEQFNEERTHCRLPDCPRCGTQMEAVKAANGDRSNQCRNCGFAPTEDEYE